MKISCSCTEEVWLECLSCLTYLQLHFVTLFLCCVLFSHADSKTLLYVLLNFCCRFLHSGCLGPLVGMQFTSPNAGRSSKQYFAQDWVSCITVVLNASQIKFKCEIKYYIYVDYVDMYFHLCSLPFYSLFIFVFLLSVCFFLVPPPFWPPSNSTTPFHPLLHFSSCPVGHVHVNFNRTCSALSFVTCTFICCVLVIYTYRQIHTVKFSDKSPF